MTRNIHVCLNSSAHSVLELSSSSGDLLPEMMESETPPPASWPNKADDFEVSSWRASPDQQVVRGTMKTTPEGETLVAQGSWYAAPTGTNSKGSGLAGLQPETILGSSKHIPSKGVRTPTAASRGPEVPDTLMDML